MHENRWKQALLCVALSAAVVGCHKDANPPAQQSTVQPQQTDANGNPINNSSQAQQYPAQGGTSTATNGGNGTTAVAGSAPATAAPGRSGYAAPGTAPVAPSTVTVAKGSVLSVRLRQTISVKTAHAGDPFTGTVVSPVAGDGGVAIPEGSTVHGVVVNAHKRGHFKGASILRLTLTEVDVNGQQYQLDTRSVSRTKKGKGKRTAAFIGGGSGLGMLVGGVATGGVGLLVGGLAGAGGGTAVAGLTGNKDLVYPAESVVSFRLAEPIELRR